MSLVAQLSETQGWFIVVAVCVVAGVALAGFLMGR